jgi:hypothetical protein
MYNETPTNARINLLNDIFSPTAALDDAILVMPPRDLWPHFQRLLDSPTISSCLIVAWKTCFTDLYAVAEGASHPRPKQEDIAKLCSSLSLDPTDHNLYSTAIGLWAGDATAEIKKLQQEDDDSDEDE